MQLTPADEAKLVGVNPDLVRVIRRAALMSKAPFRVLEGMRTIDRQRQLVAKGASKTMNSRHLTGHAVDIAPLDDGEVSWAWPLYYPLAKTVKEAAKKEGVSVEWGGDWTSFKDGPHWQLPWTTHPGGSANRAAREAAPITGKTEAQATKGRIVEEGIKVAGAASPFMAALAGVPWQTALVFGLLVLLGLAAWRIVPHLGKED